MPTFIIAEAGVNHNGNIELAKSLIDIACEAGCDAIKFQTFKADNLVIKSAQKAEYQIKNTGNNDSQYDMLKKLELSYENHKELIKYCNSKNILFLSTPFDEESVDMLYDLGIKLFKIPSGEITNKPFLKYIAKKQKTIILSTGMSTLGEVEEALKWIYEEGNYQVTLLHCTSNYPAEISDVNLKAMLTLKDAFKVKVGYSDHTLGTEVSIAAVALGAEVIEKHFTLDKNMEGPDHKASLEPLELKKLVQAIRNIEIALGDGVKKPSRQELSTREVVRKSIVTCRSIEKGETITHEMLALKRPGTGLEAKYLEMILNKKATRNLPSDYILQIGDFQ
ncbi:MAG: N-acetylneuraminate synthase [Deferribacteraceae bacterium]|jgi:N-acetylneuraminate synthase|nr:N-acetylneuraminate synthase [Deferribacteraceae bacterium]